MAIDEGIFVLPLVASALVDGGIGAQRQLRQEKQLRGDIGLGYRLR